jgi:hypothetical protein
MARLVSRRQPPIVVAKIRVKGNVSVEVGNELEVTDGLILGVALSDKLRLGQLLTLNTVTLFVPKLAVAR